MSVSSPHPVVLSELEDVLGAVSESQTSSVSGNTEDQSLGAVGTWVDGLVALDVLRASLVDPHLRSHLVTKSAKAATFGVLQLEVTATQSRRSLTLVGTGGAMLMMPSSLGSV